MCSHACDPGRGGSLGPTDHRLLADPLEFIHEDHLREREICSVIDRLAGSATLQRGEADEALAFLENELPLHLLDEEEDLFPLLKRRCQAEDEIGRAIQRLSADHEHAVRDTPRVTDILRQIARGENPLTDKNRRVLARFTYHARRHLTLENAIILPFARLRLTEGDLETLRLRMMQRRGLDTLKETPDAQ